MLDSRQAQRKRQSQGYKKEVSKRSEEMRRIWRPSATSPSQTTRARTENDQNSQVRKPRIYSWKHFVYSFESVSSLLLLITYNINFTWPTICYFLLVTHYLFINVFPASYLIHTCFVFVFTSSDYVELFTSLPFSPLISYTFAFVSSFTLWLLDCLNASLPRSFTLSHHGFFSLYFFVRDSSQLLNAFSPHLPNLVAILLFSDNLPCETSFNSWVFCAKMFFELLICSMYLHSVPCHLKL